MNQRERDALDRHITGNYGEDQFADYDNLHSCPHCEGVMVKSGGALRAGGMKQRYQCNDCGYPLVMNDEEYVPRRKRVNR